MEKLNHILRSHVAEGEDTKDKLLGAAFIVVNKDGESLYIFHPIYYQITDNHVNIKVFSSKAQPVELTSLWIPNHGL